MGKGIKIYDMWILFFKKILIIDKIYTEIFGEARKGSYI